MKTIEEILSEHTGVTGIYLTHGEVRGSDAMEAMGEYGSMLILANEEKWKGILQELKNDLLMFKDKCNHQQKIGLDIAIEQTDRYKNGKLS